MKKLKNQFFILPLLLFFLASNAQRNTDALILTEKNFAAYSVENGIKNAFLKYIDSSAIAFKDYKPVNGLLFWEERKAANGILNWKPQYAETSLSGDFGYDTGPYTYQQNSVRDSILARGQFITVWKTDPSGNWKFLIDMGIEVSRENNFETVVKIKHATVKPGNSMDLQKAEEHFISIFQINPASAYKKYLSDQSVLNRPGKLPAFSKADKLPIIKTSSGIDFTYQGSGISASGDLGFVYGICSNNVKKENYLRIWRKEKEGWRIALEVVRL